MTKICLQQWHWVLFGDAPAYHGAWSSRGERERVTARSRCGVLEGRVICDFPLGTVNGKQMRCRDIYSTLGTGRHMGVCAPTHIK